MLQQTLREETIFLDLDAADSEAALGQMLDRIPVWGLKPEERNQALKLLIQREKRGTTAIGGGVALPHCIFSGIPFPLASLGISREGIAFPSLDGEPVHLVFLLMVPENEDAHQELRRSLHDMEVLFRDRFVKERLKISESAEEAFEIILRESQQVLAAG